MMDEEYDDIQSLTPESQSVSDIEPENIPESFSDSDNMPGDIDSGEQVEEDSSDIDNLYDYKEHSDEDEYDANHQDEEILNAEAAEKNPEKEIANKNDATFLDRNKLLLIIGGVAFFLILFVAIVLPSLKVKKKKKDISLEKNGSVYIPRELTNYETNYTDNNEEDSFADRKPDFNNSNSSKEEVIFDKDFEDKFPPIVEEKKKEAPVQVPNKSGSSGSSDVPITNRNEQQKPLQFVPIDALPTTGNGNNYNNKYNYPSGYEAYESGYKSSGNAGTGYTPAALSDNVAKMMASQGNNNNYQNQNNQSGKQQFIDQYGLGGNYQWNSDYSLWKGTVISAVLDTGINTDLPGSVMAHVNKNVYSSKDGCYLLIPQGSRLYGEYNSDISYGQNRVQVVWNTLIRPDGLEINLGGMNGIDKLGYSGYKGWKSEHPFEYMKAFGLITMYSILDTKATNLIDTQNNTYAQNALSDVYSESKKLNNRIVERALDIQPTNKIKSGTVVNLITNVTIDLPPLDDYPVEEKYVRN